MRPKNPHAVALGRKGGTARAKALTPQQRQASAKKASRARWDAIRAATVDERQEEGV